LIDAFFILGTFQTLAEKFLPYPTEFLLDQGQAVLKRGMPTLAGIFALFNFSL
jgi:hypothetical protein